MLYEIIATEDQQSYNTLMGKGTIERTMMECDSHAEADAINLKFYRSLSPRERLDIALELMANFYETHPRFERIYRTAELGECPVSSDWGLGVQSIRRSTRHR